MNGDIAIAGSGGQGVLLIGRLLAEASLLEGREVVWLPYYGAEKRGGTVWCNIAISNEEIGAMFITRPTAAIAMNPAALEKLEPAMKPGGLLVVNQSLVSSKVSRQDIRTVYVSANHLAGELGDVSVGNLVALGALLSGFPVVSESSIMTVLENMFSRNKGHLEINKQALGMGYAWAGKSK